MPTTKTRIEYRAEDGFIENSRNGYPSYILHAVHCPVAKRSKYGTFLTSDEAADRLSHGYSSIRPDFHEACIPSQSDIWRTLIVRSGEMERARRDADRRREDITSLAIIKTVAARLEKELGELSDEETVAFRRTSTWVGNPERTGGHSSIAKAQQALAGRLTITR